MDILPATGGFFPSESAMMQLVAPLLCISLWLLCLHPDSLSAQQSSKFRYGQHRKETPGRRRFCDPSFRNQTVGVIDQVNQTCGVFVYLKLRFSNPWSSSTVVFTLHEGLGLDNY